MFVNKVQTGALCKVDPPPPEDDVETYDAELDNAEKTELSEEEIKETKDRRKDNLTPEDQKRYWVRKEPWLEDW